MDKKEAIDGRENGQNFLFYLSSVLLCTDINTINIEKLEKERNLRMDLF